MNDIIEAASRLLCDTGTCSPTDLLRDFPQFSEKEIAQLLAKAFSNGKIIATDFSVKTTVVYKIKKSLR